MADEKDNKVVPFTGITTVDVPPEKVLESAKEWGMEYCLIIGNDKDNDLCFGGNTSDKLKMLMLLERAKQLLMQTYDDGYNDTVGRRQG